MAKYKAAGDGFSPWTTYNDGAYKRYLPADPPPPAAVSDPGEYVPDGTAPAGTHNASQPGSTCGPVMPGTARTMAFIKTHNTASGHIELFEVPGPNYKANPTVATPTYFSEADANNGTWQMDGSTLVFIKTHNTASGHIELFEVPGPNYKANPTVATPTYFSEADANNGTWQMDGSTLVFIKTHNTASGHIELFEVPGPNYKANPTVATPTYFSEADANNGTWEMDGSTLVFIKTHNTASGHIELFEVPGPNYKANPTVATPTYFSEADANNGDWQMDGSTLVFIKTHNTASGHIELFEVPGPNYKANPTVATPTYFSEADANNGDWELESGGS